MFIVILMRKNFFQLIFFDSFPLTIIVRSKFIPRFADAHSRVSNRAIFHFSLRFLMHTERDLLHEILQLHNTNVRRVHATVVIIIVFILFPHETMAASEGFREDYTR